MTKKLRERAKISVAHAVPFQIRVERALIVYVVRTRFIQRIHYRLADSTWKSNYKRVHRFDEGVTWWRPGVDLHARQVAETLR